MLYLQNYVVSRGSVVVNIYEFDMKTAAPSRHNETQNKPYSSNNTEDSLVMCRPCVIHTFCVCMSGVCDCVACVENYGNGTTKWTCDKTKNLYTLIFLSFHAHQTCSFLLLLLAHFESA